MTKGSTIHIEKNFLVMEELDLNEAKQVAIDEDFGRKWRKADSEAETPQEEFELEEISAFPEPSTSAADPWPVALSGLHFGEPEESEEDSSLSFNDKSESHQDPCESAGEIEEASQEGAVAALVAKTLENKREDVSFLGARRTRVDLSFISDKDQRERVKTIIEKVIGRYATLPGQISTIPVSSSGIFDFRPTNSYISPESDSSGSEPVPQKAPKPLSPKGKKRELIFIPELQKGIKLIPKYVGMPPKILRYGTYGLTDEIVSAAKRRHPEASLEELLKFCLLQTGNSKKILNLYRFPSL